MTHDNLLIDATPQELHDAYSRGQIIGALVDEPCLNAALRRLARQHRDEVLASMVRPFLAKSCDLTAITGSGKGKLCTPWHFYIRSDGTLALRGAQATGDCVSWGIRTASDITRCWDVWRTGDEQYVKRQATALVYSGRGHTGQGASPARLSKWHVETGFLLEEIVTDSGGTKWDFREYSSYVKLGMRYGRSGLPKALIDVTKKHRIRTTTNVDDMDALADCLWNGYGAHCGSGIGVSNVGNPISSLRGSWAHDMAIVGYDDRPETVKRFGSRIWFWDQSWGNWNRVTGILPEWEPWGEGMFALNESDTWRAVRGGGCWVFSDSDGFPPRPFDNLLI